MSFDLADRGIYGFATSEHLRFADLDANGHINNGAFIELLENARVSYLRQIVRRHGEKGGLPRFRLVIGQALFDGESQCTAVQKVTMVSLNEETHRSTPFDPAVRAALEKLVASKDGLPA